MPTYYDTIIDPSGERLSSEAAEVITKTNRQRSPLLRLPAELRNKIYGYVLGGMKLRIAQRTRKLDFLAVASVDSPYAEIPLHTLTGLTLVSRQLYAETRILPFELGIMFALDFTLDHPIKRLSITQRQAILFILRLLKGLKRVQVACVSTLKPLEYSQLVEVVKKGLGREDVDVVIDFGK
ncbi:uncharacterized protein J4E79_009185 [Alternaria viburni]|uniref:uncharacterized protein n=1 Tax=Alternaria viburni TaxID=566460 RepID=UPI0020C35B4D|nr:uncharacterized protein J4E79_009185 [Alternaria viburni]KAI4651704.1 hypothetical protein J4E79_009185 [Alternaria viburni]